METTTQSSLVIAPADAEIVDVLVIDDDVTVRTVLGETLKRGGYSQRSAADGKSAMKLLAQHQFNLVITDIFMPDMDGLEVIMKYTAAKPNALILAVSGGGRYQQPAVGLKPAQILGSRRTLAKPFDLKEFLSVMKEMIGPRP